MPETVLIVDDEDGVRRTVQEWLAGVPNVRALAAGDAETALKLANTYPLDLAVLDWNLGSGSDGLRLLANFVASLGVAGGRADFAAAPPPQRVATAASARSA